MNLPELFLARMKEKLGESFPDFLSAYQNPPVRGLRVNNLKIPREEFLRRFPYSLAPVPWEENGFYVQEEKLGAHPYHFAALPTGKGIRSPFPDSPAIRSKCLQTRRRKARCTIKRSVT